MTLIHSHNSGPSLGAITQVSMLLEEDPVHIISNKIGTWSSLQKFHSWPLWICLTYPNWSMIRSGIHPFGLRFQPSYHRTSPSLKEKQMKIPTPTSWLSIYGVRRTPWWMTAFGWGFSKEPWWGQQLNGILNYHRLALQILAVWLRPSYTISNSQSSMTPKQSC